MIENFPKNFTPRPIQKQIISEIDQALESGYSDIILCASTGIGKSHIAATVAKSFESSYTVTAQKILQDQYSKDFGFMSSLKGKTNFPCLSRYDPVDMTYDKAKRDPNLSCGHGVCSQTLPSGKKEYCVFKPSLDDFQIINERTHGEIIIDPEGCHYYIQKYHALLSSHMLCNYASYFQTRKFSNVDRDLTQRQVIIADEAHEIEDQIIDFISCKITKQNLKELDLKFTNFAMNTIDDIRIMVSMLTHKYKEHIKNLESTGDNEKIAILKTQKEKFDLINYEMQKNIDNFMFQSYENNNDIYMVTIKPIDIARFVRRFFDTPVKIYMSATINQDIFCDIMGIDARDCKFIEVERSPFSVENRRVEFLNIMQLNARVSQDNYNMMYYKIGEILAKHPNEKGLVLCTSKKQCNDIVKVLGSDRLVTVHNDMPEERDVLLQRHKDSASPLVLLSPSLWFGIDLKGDQSRFQIILKTPYASFGDRRIQIKAKRSPIWYQYCALTKLLQGLGRSTRNSDDHAITYILDSTSFRLLHQMRKYIPKSYHDILYEVL